MAILLSTSFLAFTPQSRTVQGASTVAQAAREAVAAQSGAAARSVVIELIARDGDWAYGTGTVPAGSEHSAPDVHLFLAHRTGSSWQAAVRFTPDFDALLAQAPAAFPTPEIRATLDGFTAAGDGSADLAFPWAVGEAWRFNGPHANGGSRIWGAIDFYPSSSAAGAPVRAMRGGVVYRPCANTVMIDHGDGWTSYYYHVANISVVQGQSVSRGQQIGGTSAEVGCGGWASGPHVHVYLRYEGREVPMDGIDIGGWTVENGAAQYDGCLTRGEERHCAEWYSAVMNDGSTGSWSGGDGGGDTSGPVSATLSTNRATVNSSVSYTLNGYPANATVQITWRRLTGSTIDMGTVQTDRSGAASGQFRVPATPGGPNQQITFSAGAVAKTVLFEVAPRIKVNTSPGVRGQQVDVSLRGYARQEPVRIRWKKPDGTWVEVGQVTTSNTGSANIWVTVPLWAPDGNNSVRGDGTEFRQQTNAVYIEGGTFRAASVIAPDATPTATATATGTPVTIDQSALPAGDPLPIALVTDDTSTGPITAVTDHDPATVWQGDPGRGVALLTVDLGQPVTLSTVAWLQLQTGCGTIERIESSLDGQAWDRLTPAGWESTALPPTWQTLAAGGDARYIRWLVIAKSRDPLLGCLAEIAVWGTPVPADVPTENATTEPTPEATEPVSEPETPTPTETATAEPAPTDTPAETPPVATETVTETAPAAEATDESGGA